MYYVPIVSKQDLDSSHPISANLAYVLFLQNGSVDIQAAAQTDGRKNIVLARSSPRSWLMEGDNITLNPLYLSVPADDTMKAYNLAVISEGMFASAFDTAPVDEPETDSTAEHVGAGSVKADTHLTGSTQSGKLLVVGSSTVTTSSLIDENGEQPIAVFMRNALDYMCGNGDLSEMRTKGLELNTLTIKTGMTVKIVQLLNQYGIPVLVVLVGLLVWRFRVIRRRKIRRRYETDAENA
jgi:hypothetical protein